jgi:transposase
VVGRGELTDKAWAQLAPLLPRNRQRGGRWWDHRTVLNGILWKLRTGAPWRDLPERYGPWQTCYDRLVRWLQDGTWDRLLAHAQTKPDALGDLGVDRHRRRHQHPCPPARRRCPQACCPRGHQKGIAHDLVEALARSRGGLTTKIHLGCDGKGRPLGVVLTGGQRHDSTQLEPVLDAIGVLRPAGRGRPRKRPDHLVADKGYSYLRCRQLLRRRGIAHTIPQRSDQRARRASRPRRPLAFDRARYRGRNVVERCFNRLKQFRAVATRYEKRAVNYRAMVVIASLLLWLDG